MIKNKNQQKDEKELLQEISNKLDKISIVIAVQNIQYRDTKISLLKKAQLSSKEIGDLLGVTEGRIRQSKGWKKK